MFFYPISALGACGGLSLKREVRNLIMHLFTLSSSKMELLESFFFDIVITKNDHPRYVKNVLGRIHVSF